MGDSQLVRELQERAARAMPAERVEESGGWWLRHAPSCSWWIGTVLPHGDAVRPGGLERKVAEAEAFYAANGAAARFQITPGACPDGLDDLLAGRGYARRSPVSLRTAAVAHVVGRARDGGLRVRLDDGPSREWFDVWRDAQGGDVRSERAVLDRVDQPSVYARAYIGDEAVAVGRAVEDAGWVGVFGMATLEWARGKGAGRDVLAALAVWAAGRRARHMYLQVRQDNPAALRLYERMGFAELRGYHYRTSD